MILTVALVAQSLLSSFIVSYTVGGRRHCIYSQLQCLLSRPGVAVFRLKAFSLCEVAECESGKIDRFFLLFNGAGNQGIRDKGTFHSIPGQYRSRKIELVCFFFITVSIIIIYGNNYYSGQQLGLITFMNLFFILLKGRHDC